MYAPTYGYGLGSNSTPFNPNGAPPQPHNPHQQQQPGQQQPQPMMYNPQQFVGAHQSPYGAQGPGMGGNAGGMGMMPNNGMAHMAGGHVPPYQTPYSGSPYGAGIPVSSSANVNPNFMPTSNAQPFPMGAPNMNPQQHQGQRMQPPPPSSTPTQPGARASPFAGGQHNTPPNAGPAQSQFSTPQNPLQTQSPNNNQQSQGGTIVTPQTPNFPSGVQGAGASMAAPLSPGSESREKERVTLLLDINRVLLMEVMQLQAAQAESKKEESSPKASSPDGSGDKEKKEVEKSKTTSGREYVECMRRLQANLAYLAAIADRSHKPSSQIPSHPAFITAPPLTAKPSTGSKKEESDKGPEDPEEDRVETLKQQYKQLQALFPDVDPKKEPQMQSASTVARAQQAAQMQAQQKQQQGQGQGQPGDATAQQKLQNDKLRQKMMQQAQNTQQMAQGMQQAQNNQQMAQAMQGPNMQQQSR